MGDPEVATGETIRLARRGCNAVVLGAFYAAYTSNRPAAPMPPPMHIVTIPVPPPRFPELVDELRRQLRAGRAERMPERDRAAVHIHLLLIEPEVAHHGHDLRRERLVEFDQLDVLQRRARRA